MAKNDGEIIIEVKLEQDEMKRKIAELENNMQNMSDTVAQSGKGFTILRGTMANLVSNGINKVSAGLNKLKGDVITNSAVIKAQNAQYEQTFGTMESAATKAIHNVASESDILDTRLKETGTRMFAFAKTTGMQAPQALGLMERALKVTADQAAYYDRSLEEVSESLQSFLKGNYENDAALGLSCTETTRNAAANKLYGKSFMQLSEAQKQLTLLQMVEDANALSGALGQAARESDGWENVLGNLNEEYRQFTNNIGSPILDNLIPTIQRCREEFHEWSESIDWEAYGRDVTKYFNMLKRGLDISIDAFPKLINYTKKAIPLVVSLGTAYAGLQAGKEIKGLIGPTKQVFSLLKNGNGILNTFAIMSQHGSAEAADFGIQLIKAGGGVKGLSTMLLSAVGGPIGLAIGAVGMLAVGTLTWANSMKNSSAMAMETKTVTEELEESLQGLNESVSQSKQAFDGQMQSAEVNYNTSKLLTEQIDMLASKESKSASEKAKLKALIDELNTIMPDLNLQYNEETDSLNMSTQAIYNKIEAMKEQAKQEAYMEQYKATVKQVAEAETNLAKVQSQKDSISRKLTESNRVLNEELKKGTAEYSNKRGEIVKLESELNELNNAESKYKDALNEANESMEVSSDMLENKLVPATEDVRAKFDELSAVCLEKGIEIPQSVANGIMEGQYVLPETVEGMQSLIQFDNLIMKATDAGISIPSSLSQGIADGSISIQEGIAQLNRWVEFQTAINKAGLQGTQIPSKLAAGILNGSVSVDEAMASVQKSVDSKTSDTTKQNDNGRKQSAEFGRGISNGVSSASNAARRVSSSANTGFGSQVPGAFTAGQNISNGLSSGIRSMASSVAASAAGVARGAINAAKAALDEHSPSKVFDKMGVFAWMGYNHGQDSQLGEVQKYSTRNAIASIEATKQAIRSASFGDLRYKSNFNNSSYVSATPTGIGSTYQINQTFNGTGTPDPATAARELKMLMHRMEWERK